MRMNDEGVPKKALKGYTEGKRPFGRPTRRLIDAVDRDSKRVFKCKNWRKSAEDRDAWMKRIEETKAQVGL
jgi:hypothetical protein